MCEVTGTKGRKLKQGIPVISVMLWLVAGGRSRQGRSMIVPYTDIASALTDLQDLHTPHLT